MTPRASPCRTSEGVSIAVQRARKTSRIAALVRVLPHRPVKKLKRFCGLRAEVPASMESTKRASQSTASLQNRAVCAWCSCPARRHRHGRRPSCRAADTSRSLPQIWADANEIYARSKDAWCQPWSIVAAGCSIEAVSWLLFAHGWWTILFAASTAVVALWWCAPLIVCLLRACEAC